MDETDDVGVVTTAVFDKEDKLDKRFKDKVLDERRASVKEGKIDSDSSVQIGSYCVVEITGTINSTYYVGIVIELEKDEFIVSFLKKTSSGLFIYPLIEDKSYIKLNEIHAILSAPEVDRRERYLFKKEEISKFNITY